jgi:hypothetical protein
MANGVKLTVTGLPSGTAIGATVTYQVGQIPVASVDLVPPGDLKITGGFGNIDGLKRQNEISIDVSVDAFAGDSGNTSRKLSFKGLLDGLTVGNMVGGNTYQAVVKNKAQTLLELTTHTPGLYPTSVNIFKNPSYAMTLKPGEGESGAVQAWNIADKELKHNQPVIKFYTDLMLWLIGKQKGNWKMFAGRDKMVDGKLPFEKIYNDPRYQSALTEAQRLFSSVDLSAVSNGAVTNLKASHPTISGQIAETFKKGPNVLLENYQYFLSQLGCTLIFSNNKMYVVPENSVLKPDSKAVEKGVLQKKPNTAGPADYNAYMYNDNGYRDIAHVLVQLGSYVGGVYLADLTFERGVLATYSDTELSHASGVLVVAGHPWLALSTTNPLASSGKQGKQRMDKPKDSMHDTPTNFTDAKKQAKQNYVTGTKEGTNSFKENAALLSNYAETKFYQARFTDRHGSLTMDFNPNWVPGTGGSLYIRETSMFISFYVTSVTHRIDQSPPTNGSAITVVNFSCGRMSSSPKGTSSDKFLGYDIGKEQTIQAKFIKDNQ